MADVRPFRGIRFDPTRVDIGAAVCPPYDVITAAEQRAYHHRDDHNIIRVELGEGPTDPSLPGNRYQAAAQALSAWRADGALLQEGRPSIYLYEQGYRLGGETRRRRGLLVAGRLHEPAQTGVLPHEDTRKGPIEDRLALLRATATNVSPLWLLYDDSQGRVGAALARSWDKAPVAVAEAEGGSHRLWTVDDPATLRAVTAAFADRPLFIADGHHRYKTAQVYRDERRAVPPGASAPDGGDAGYEFALMLLVALDDPGLTVLPTHRLLRQLGRPLSAVREDLAAWMTFRPLTLPGEPDRIPAFLEETLARAGRGGDGTADGHAFVLLDRDGAWVLRPREDRAWRERLPGGHSASWGALDVAVLDALVIRGALGIEAQQQSAGADATSHGATDQLAYVSSTAEAVDAVRSGAADQAYLLNPTPVEQVCAVAAAGDRMPPKSTFFYPKPVTGLVLHALDGTRPPA